MAFSRRKLRLSTRNCQVKNQNLIKSASTRVHPQFFWPGGPRPTAKTLLTFFILVLNLINRVGSIVNSKVPIGGGSHQVGNTSLLIYYRSIDLK